MTTSPSTKMRVDSPQVGASVHLILTSVVANLTLVDTTTEMLCARVAAALVRKLTEWTSYRPDGGELI